MKKYFLLPAALFALACNSNSDKVSDGNPESNINKVELNPVDSTSGEGLLSGNFEISDYKKDNVKVDLPKTTTKFTRSGEVLRSDGNSFLYKIKGDSIFFMIDDKNIMSSSKIEFLDANKSSFLMKNDTQKTEFTYKKIN